MTLLDEEIPSPVLPIVQPRVQQPSTPSPKESLPAQFYCRHCGKGFTDHRALDSHLAELAGQEFFCKVCDAVGDIELWNHHRHQSLQVISPGQQSSERHGPAVVIPLGLVHPPLRQFPHAESHDIPHQTTLRDSMWPLTPEGRSQPARGYNPPSRFHCNNCFENQGVLDSHRATLLMAGHVSCDECHSVFHSELNMIEHWKYLHGRPVVQGSPVPERFTTPPPPFYADSIQHPVEQASQARPKKALEAVRSGSMRMPTSETPPMPPSAYPPQHQFDCKKCNLTFEYRQQLDHHRQSCDKEYSCEMCGTACDGPRSLEDHSYYCSGSLGVQQTPAKPRVTLLMATHPAPTQPPIQQGSPERLDHESRPSARFRLRLRSQNPNPSRLKHVPFHVYSTATTATKTLQTDGSWIAIG